MITNKDNRRKEEVSIIVPIYNASKYLKECITSIERQTYPHLQIILINDGSTDNSLEICKKIVKMDSRIILKTQKNQGVSVARNTGLSIATGEWVMFVDPDDILDRNIVKILLGKVNQQIDIVCCSCYGFDGKNKERAHFFTHDRLFFKDKKDLYLQLLNSEYGQSNRIFTAIGVPWGKIYRKRFLTEKNLKFNPKLRRMQDNIFNMYAFNSARQIYYMDIPLYFYRLDHLISFNKRKNKKNFEVYHSIINARYRAFKVLNLYNQTDLYQGYVNATAEMFLGMIDNLIENNVSSKLIKEKIDYLKKELWMEDILSKKAKKLINKKTISIKLNLINNNFYDIYIMLTKLKLRIKKNGFKNS